MKQSQVVRARDRVLRRVPDLHEIVRGSLLERVIRHRRGCPKCAAGDGHPVWVLTVGYPGGRTRQLSLRAEQVPQVRAWLDNYQQLKATMEEVCELNQRLLRPEARAPPPRRGARA
jgi:hypothetical protein